MTTSKQQSGFGTIGVAVIVLVLLAIGGISFAVMKKTSVKSAVAAAPSASNKHAETATPQPKPAATSNYPLKELGVSLTVRDSLKDDLVYEVQDAQLSNGETTKVAYFSTKLLMEINSDCAPSKTSIAALEIANGQYPKDDKNVGSDYGPLLKQFPDKFVTFQTSRADCIYPPDSSTTQLYSEIEQNLREDVQTVEEIK